MVEECGVGGQATRHRQTGASCARWWAKITISSVLGPLGMGRSRHVNVIVIGRPSEIHHSNNSMTSTTTMMKEAIQALYPPRLTASRRRVRRLGSSISSSNDSFHENSLPQFRGFDANVTAPNNPPLSTSYSTSSNRKSKDRFSELLLEHGERDLHQDWAVCASSTLTSSGNSVCVGISCSSQMKQIEGRLRLCSQSIVFEPHQTSRGIIRAPFRHMTYLGGGDNNGNSTEMTVGVVRCERHVVMKSNNAIGPFDYIHTPVEFSFRFVHSSPSMFLSLAKKLFDVEASNKKASVSFAPSVTFEGSAPPIIQLPSNNYSRDAVVEQIMRPALNRLFDTTNFLHVSERSLTPNLRCSIKALLLEHNGCALLTEFGFYFQPAVASGMMDAGSGAEGRVGVNGKFQVWAIDDMRAIARRYDGMKDRALEIYLKNQHSILLTFESTLVRERVIRILSQQISAKKPVPLPCFTDRSFVESALELWQADELDNFEYLLCLNAAAGRSYHDLSRYPVFPWVLAYYGGLDEDDDLDDSSPEELDFADPSIFRDLSLPIGALNDSRFEEFRKRYEGMVQQQKSHASQYNQDFPFMYGTHYSAPGYVLYYLLRVLPEHMLCLQNGKFDVPDRLFHSIDATYKSILSNPADVKELIPEFYDPDCFDFLINSMGLQLGTLQTGQRVNDVLLPSWAKSAKSFLQQNRAALESDYCTKHLPKWIDLIFGVTSRGPGAKAAKNLFHPMSYMSPEEVEAIQSPEGRAHAELQSTEFGIVP
jgi:factor associated with neutral sphingomyelinase activation